MSRHIFSSPDTFGALYAAQKWCKENGYSYGSTCRTGYVGIMHGDVLIAKWHNLTQRERSECDGIMSGNFRDGPVIIEIKQ